MGVTGAEIYVDGRGSAAPDLHARVASAVGELGRTLLPFTAEAIVLQTAVDGLVAVATDEVEPIDAAPLSALLPATSVVSSFTMGSEMSTVVVYRDGEPVGEIPFGMPDFAPPGVDLPHAWGEDSFGISAKALSAFDDAAGLLDAMGIPEGAVGLHPDDFAPGADLPDWAHDAVRVRI